MSCCDGRCCAVFYLSGHTRESFAAQAEHTEDGAFILDMIIPLNHVTANARARRFGGKADREREESGKVFTCRHWDEDTRLCTVYDERPHMCREYPYESECSHGCGFELPMAAKEARACRLAA